ncbi:MAG: class I tRNA ligase family protein, partial [archaeon]
LVDENGNFNEEAGKYAGLNASKDNLKFKGFVEEKGLLVREADVDHEYAHCWRCKSPVIFRAVPNWYLKVTDLKEKMIEENKHMRWVPDWAGERWFRDWLENIQDWCISRQRFWGIPLPIWRCENGHIKLVGNRSELPKDVKDLHRPWIDNVKFKCKECGKEMTRVPDILDVWLDSGASPWATLPFPESKTELDKWFPCEFITEGKDQIRGWFNSLLCLSMVSHGKTSYKSVYMHGFVVDDKGMKMSKSLGNVTAPSEVIEKVGSEAWRLYSIGAANNGEDMRFNWEELREAYKALNILWNVVQFAQYMEAADFNPESYKLDTKKLKPEDKWLLSRINTLNEQVTKAFEDYEFPRVPKLLREFVVEDLSRWYVKLIRDRTWVSAKGDDKLVAFKVLYEAIRKFLILSAPLLPIVTEELYLSLIKPLSKKLPESIHLVDWPSPDTKMIKADLETQMKIVRSIVETARFAREEAKIKLRWPLKQLAVEGYEAVKKALKTFEAVILEQANVKSLKAGKIKGVEKDFEFGKAYLDTEITQDIKEEALARELMRAVQVMRKKAGLTVGEQIKLIVSTSDDFAKSAVQRFDKEITLKVGAKELKIGDGTKAKEKAEMEFEGIKISLAFEKK